LLNQTPYNIILRVSFVQKFENIASSSPICKKCEEHEYFQQIHAAESESGEVCILIDLLDSTDYL